MRDFYNREGPLYLVRCIGTPLFAEQNPRSQEMEIDLLSLRVESLIWAQDGRASIAMRRRVVTSVAGHPPARQK